MVALLLHLTACNRSRLVETQSIYDTYTVKSTVANRIQNSIHPLHPLSIFIVHPHRYGDTADREKKKNKIRETIFILNIHCEIVRWCYLPVPPCMHCNSLYPTAAAWRQIQYKGASLIPLEKFYCIYRRDGCRVARYSISSYFLYIC